MMFEERFRKDFPDLLPVENDKNEEVLRWAAEHRYVTLTAAPNGALYYSKEDLEKALMWREKIDD